MDSENSSRKLPFVSNQVLQIKKKIKQFIKGKMIRNALLEKQWKKKYKEYFHAIWAKISSMAALFFCVCKVRTVPRRWNKILWLCGIISYFEF